MRRRRRRFQPDAKAELQLTSMIDVTFLLLIFFMCTLEFRDLEGLLESHLPRHGGEGASPELVEKARVKLTVLEEGTRLELGADVAWNGVGGFRYGLDRRLRYQVGPHATASLVEVRARLDALHAMDPELELVVDARPGTVYADVVSVVDVGRAAGYGTISFAGAR